MCLQTPGNLVTVQNQSPPARNVSSHPGNNGKDIRDRVMGPQTHRHVCACSVTHSCPTTLCNPWTVARQAPLSMASSRQEYWSGLPFPSPGDLPDPGIRLRSPALQVDSVPSELPESQTDLGSNHDSTPSLLCDLGKVAEPLYYTASSSIK